MDTSRRLISSLKLLEDDLRNKLSGYGSLVWGHISACHKHRARLSQRQPLVYAHPRNVTVLLALPLTTEAQARYVIHTLVKDLTTTDLVRRDQVLRH
jgi:hypothetical protein